MIKIYLAIPYTKIDKDLSFKIANAVSARLMNKGYCVFSPISHSHIMARDNSLPVTWDFWKEIDTEFIKWADELWVVELDGWQDSTGVQAEIEIALSFKKTIVRVKPEFLGIDINDFRRIDIEV